MEILREWLTPGVSWFLAGIILIIIELMSPGLIFMFFAFGAFVVSLLSLSDTFAANYTLQFTVFSIVSVLSLILLRSRMKEIFDGKESNDSVEIDDDFIGKKVTVTAAITKQKDGKVMVHGTNWKAQSDEEFSEGDSVVIIKKDNLTMIVESIK